MRCFSEACFPSPGAGSHLLPGLAKRRFVALSKTVHLPTQAVIVGFHAPEKWLKSVQTLSHTWWEGGGGGRSMFLTWIYSFSPDGILLLMTL